MLILQKHFYKYFNILLNILFILFEFIFIFVFQNLQQQLFRKHPSFLHKQLLLCILEKNQKFLNLNIGINFLQEPLWPDQFLLKLITTNLLLDRVESDLLDLALEVAEDQVYVHEDLLVDQLVFEQVVVHEDAFQRLQVGVDVGYHRVQILEVGYLDIFFSFYNYTIQYIYIII